MIDCVKLAAKLKYEHLVRQVLYRVVCWNLDLDPLRRVRLGDVEDLAPWFCICAMVTAELRLGFAFSFVDMETDIRERRGEADREPLASCSGRPPEWIQKYVHLPGLRL
jgi:hypothetical protein